MEFEHSLVIGDWSNDGHGRSERFTFKCSHDDTTIIKAYKKAVKLCKVSLHHQSGATSICCEYDSTIKAPQLKALKELGVDFSFRESKFSNKELSCTSQDIAHLFFEMAKTQIPDFKYKLIKEKPPINGWGLLPETFGYGVFYT